MFQMAALMKRLRMPNQYFTRKAAFKRMNYVQFDVSAKVLYWTYRNRN